MKEEENYVVKWILNLLCDVSVPFDVSEGWEPITNSTHSYTSKDLITYSELCPRQ